MRTGTSASFGVSTTEAVTRPRAGLVSVSAGRTSAWTPASGEVTPPETTRTRVVVPIGTATAPLPSSVAVTVGPLLHAVAPYGRTSTYLPAPGTSPDSVSVAEVPDVTARGATRIGSAGTTTVPVAAGEVPALLVAVTLTG